MDELERRYHQSSHAWERSRWQILWLLSNSHTSQGGSEVTSYSLHWIQALARRYNQHEPESMADGRRQNRGQPQSQKFQSLKYSPRVTSNF